jgi:protein lysine acetyltransferase
VTAVRANELAALEFFAGCSPETLMPLAALLRPLAAGPGEVLMRQGEPAVSFLLIGSGRARVTHAGSPDGHAIVVDVPPGMIVGEIALLRGKPRTATVVALDQLAGWVGDQDAFSAMLDIPAMMQRLVRLARQRLAAFLTSIPVRMRDGTVLYLRPVLPGDNARTISGPVQFSTETLYRRFQTTKAPTPSLMAYLFEVDYVDHFVWVMTDGPDGPVVADARFVRDYHDPTTAEVAFIVGDLYQGRGIGSFLMDAVAVAAAAGGVRTFTARVLTDNYPMRKILDRYGATWQRDDLNVVITEIDVPKLRDLSITRDQYRDIHAMARQVMRTVG